MQVDLVARRRIPMVQVDAFTSKPLCGNPAAVVLMTEQCHERSDDWMLAVAAENNLSETAFVRIREEEVSLRWFTPTKEVELCGHATLAATHALYERNLVPAGQRICFSTVFSGNLFARRGEDGMIELDFPAVSVEATDFSDVEYEAIINGFRISKADILFTGKTIYDCIIEVTPAALRTIIDIDFAAVSRIASRGVVLTCRGHGSDGQPGHSDFSSRCFFPRYAPYMTKYLGLYGLCEVGMESTRIL